MIQKSGITAGRKHRPYETLVRISDCCSNCVESVGMEGALPPAQRKGFAFPAQLPRFSLQPRRREGSAFGGAAEVDD